MTITGLPGPGEAGRLPSAGAERAMPGDWTAEVRAAAVASRRPRRRLRTTLLWIAESLALLLVYVEQAYHDIAASLEEFKALADRRGFSPLLIVFPIPGQVRASDPPVHLQRRLEAIARKAGLPTLDLLAPMREAWTVKHDVYIPFDNTDLSPRGHEVVAKTLEAYLTERRLVRDAAEPPRPSRAGQGRADNG